MKTYPEHEKVHAIKDKSQAIGEFLNWLSEDGIWLYRMHEHTEDCEEEGNECELRSGSLIPDYERTEKKLARYFDIDLNRLEAEKRAMLAELRGEIE